MLERYSIRIADTEMTIMSDESQEFIANVVSKIDSRVREMLTKSKHCSNLDAALLCAIDYCAEKMKLERQIKNLEAQNSLYEVNVNRLKTECELLRAKCAAMEAGSETEDENA